MSVLVGEAVEVVVKIREGSKRRHLFVDNGGADALRSFLAVRGDASGQLLYAGKKNGELLEGRSMTDQAIYARIKRCAKDGRCEITLAPRHETEFRALICSMRGLTSPSLLEWRGTRPSLRPPDTTGGRRGKEKSGKIPTSAIPSSKLKGDKMSSRPIRLKANMDFTQREVDRCLKKVEATTLDGFRTTS